MKNKKLVMTFAVMIFMISLINVSHVSADAPEDAISLHSKVGKLFSDNQKVESRAIDVYAMGKNTTISQQDIDQAIKFYVIAGFNEEDARIKAEDYVFGREVMYNKAIQEGYQVTATEIQQYIEDCKLELETIANKDEIKAIISEFDSEEAYWNQQFKVYQKNLPSEKYVKALEEKFWNEKKNQHYGSPEEIDKEWIEYYESFRKNLIAEEEYQIIGK